MTEQELLEILASELFDVYLNREHSNENDVRYFQRKAEGLYHMLLGLDVNFEKVFDKKEVE